MQGPLITGNTSFYRSVTLSGTKPVIYDPWENDNPKEKPKDKKEPTEDVKLNTFTTPDGDTVKLSSLSYIN